MYVVMTRVKLKPNSAESCVKLFEQSNPALVQKEPDWLGAKMIFDSETDVITVLATWRDIGSYKRFSNSNNFKNTMQRFAEYFSAPPEISTNELLVEMRP